MINLFARVMNHFLTQERFARKQGVKIGFGCDILTRNWGSEPYLITIGNHVQITDNVAFFTHGGGWIFRTEIPDFDIFGKIIVKDNVYIGSGTYILPGVTIESNVIIAARSVVTKSIPEGVVVAGNPAKIIGTTDGYKSKNIKYNLKTKGFSVAQKRKTIENAGETLFIKSHI